MSSFDDFQIPPPADWQKFERFCRDLFSAHWADPSAQQNGRGGQQQNGVDCFGRNWTTGELEGVQCKGKDGRYDKALTVDELTKEVGKALTFKPRLSRFILATSGQADAKVQQVAREISVQHRAKGLFPVEVLSWDMLVGLLEKHADVFRAHYGDLVKKIFAIGQQESPLIAIRHQSQEGTTEAFQSISSDGFGRAVISIDCDSTMAYENGVLNPLVALRPQMSLVQQLQHQLALHGNADVAYFGIAHIPLIFHAGMSVSTKRRISLYELQRSSGDWVQLSADVGPDLGITLSELRGEASDDIAVLSIEVSYPVPVADIEAAVRADFRHWKLSIDKPRIDAVQHESQVKELADAFRAVLDAVHNEMDNRPLHVFYAGPVSVAFRMGQHVSQTIHGPVIVHNYSARSTPRYAWAIDLNAANFSAKQVLFAELKDMYV
ncbi:hypothetical protein AWB77_01486 [Caballeronia fortuita]|uniref:SMODS-associated and fused to various effectors domain-containing protein n=1 Tax=Caballeronia fortuita TaxID=1777138 RepID=A0A158A817_9BURK|nr:SAVED domain-containing protein [Caballeronia fortuita]SAK53958.1 hypothetical protein AWB77_01486 [Caballeronia fortuita]